MPWLSKVIKGATVSGTLSYSSGAGGAVMEAASLTEESGMAGGLPEESRQAADRPQEPAAEEAVAPVKEPSAGGATGLFSGADMEELVKQKVQEQVEQQLRERTDAAYARGKAEAEAEYRHLKEKARLDLEEAARCLREARSQARQIVNSAEKTIVELAMAVADNLLRGQLDLTPEKVLPMVREAIRELEKGEDKLLVYLNPSDLPVCSRNWEKVAEDMLPAKIEFLPDDNLSRGSCRVESENGVVEYILEQEWARLKDRLLELAERKGKVALEETGESYEWH